MVVPEYTLVKTVIIFCFKRKLKWLLIADVDLFLSSPAHLLQNHSAVCLNELQKRKTMLSIRTDEAKKPKK